MESGRDSVPSNPPEIVRVSRTSVEIDWVCDQCGAMLVCTAFPKGTCEWCGAPRAKFRAVEG